MFWRSSCMYTKQTHLYSIIQSGSQLRTPHTYLMWQIPSDILVWFSWVYAISLSQNIIYGMLYVIETCETYYFILFIPATWRYTDIVSKYIQNEQLECRFLLSIFVWTSTLFYMFISHKRPVFICLLFQSIK